MHFNMSCSISIDAGVAQKGHALKAVAGKRTVPVDIERLVGQTPYAPSSRESCKRRCHIGHWWLAATQNVACKAVLMSASLIEDPQDNPCLFDVAWHTGRAGVANQALEVAVQHGGAWSDVKATCSGGSAAPAAKAVVTNAGGHDEAPCCCG